MLEIWGVGHLESEEKVSHGEAPMSCQELYLVRVLESKVKILIPALKLGKKERGRGILGLNPASAFLRLGSKSD